MTVVQMLLIGSVILFLGCNINSTDTSHVATDTQAVKVKIDTPANFVMNYGANDNNPLFVFVGEKILVKPLPSKETSMDNCFKAKYAILKKIYGEFLHDTIEFIVFDHYGTPYFSQFKNVMLYVSADSGTYYHQKYMYNNVYKTKNGSWAGPYEVADYEHEYNRRTTVKPIRIYFQQPVCFPTKLIDEEHVLLYNYPQPYYKIIRDTAFAIYGNYVEDLFKLKKEGFLTARGLFTRDQ